VPTSITLCPVDPAHLLVGYVHGGVALVDIETGQAVTQMLCDAAPSSSSASASASSLLSSSLSSIQPPALSSSSTAAALLSSSLTNGNASTANGSSSSSSSSGSSGGSGSGTHVMKVVAHPHSPLVFVANVDRQVRCFDLNTGRVCHKLLAHRGVVSALALQPLGQHLVSGSHDQSLRFWDLKTWKLLQNIDPHQTHRSKYNEAIHAVQFHSTYPLLASAGADSIVRVYV
jgi:WD40 repeat protein